MKRRALFLDRDGVINEDSAYVGSVDRFVFKDGIFDLLRAAQDKGYLLVIVTNQSGVARGLFTADDYEAVTAHMTDALRQRGITLDLCLACFALKDGAVPAHAYDSFWRKPAPGMILEATARLNIDLARSIMLGDSERDMQAAQAAGVGTQLLLSGQDAQAADVRTIATLKDATAFL